MSAYVERGKEKKLTPSIENIFNFARLTPYNNIRVVVVGQDPYPKKGDANGLAFSSYSKKVPASLRNIYKCLHKQNLITDMPKSADLSTWAEQGVLLLNASLTTVEGKSNAHAKLWEAFTDKLIYNMSRDVACGRNDSLIFMLWGGFAQSKKSLISDECVVLEWRHPSPLAQNVVEEKKFINCNHFAKVNEYLVDFLEDEPINWRSVCEDKQEKMDGQQKTANDIADKHGTASNGAVKQFRGSTHIVYTDGACSNNQASNPLSVAGYAAYVHDGPLKGNVIYGKMPPAIVKGDMIYGTNIRGEGLAIFKALELIFEKDSNPEITLFTDCKNWKDMINTFMPRWEKNNKDFNTQKNPDITIPMYELVKKIKSNGKLTVNWVKAHSTNAMNNLADKYAVLGTKMQHFDKVNIMVPVVVEKAKNPRRVLKKRNKRLRS